MVKAALDVGVERFVEFSTSEVYGPFIHKGKEDDLDDDRPDRREPLGLRRQQAGVRAPLVRALPGRRLPLVIVRPFNVYGPRQVGDGAIRGMIAAGAAEPADHALQRRHADSRLVLRRRTSSTACCAARSSPAAIGHAFNLGNPQGTVTNFELAQLIIRLTNSKSEIVFKPHPGPEVDLRVPSIEKAMSAARTSSRRCRSRPASRARSRGTRESRRGQRQERKCVKLLVTGASGSSAATCCCARRATGRSWRCTTGRRGLEAFVAGSRLAQCPRRSGAICSSAGDVQALAGRGRPPPTRCCTSPPTAIRPRRPRGPRWDLDSNTVAVVTFLEHCPADHLVYVSSGAVYDGLSGAVTPATPVVAASAVRDLEARREQYVRFFAERRGTRRRATSTSASSAPTVPTSRCARSRRAGCGDCARPARVRRCAATAQNLIDFMYVDDAVDGFLALAEARRHARHRRLRVGHAGERQRRRRSHGARGRRRRRHPPRRRGRGIHRVPLRRPTHARTLRVRAADLV